MIYPQSFNRYAYVGNDPISSIDPLGLVSENVWSLWAGFRLLGGTNITWDGASVPQYMLGMVAHLWMSGGVNILPPGAIVGGRGQIVVDDVLIASSNPNDYWRSLPQNFIRGPLWNNASKAKQDRVIYIVQKILANQGCLDWFKARSEAIGHGADLTKLLQKTGLNFYLSSDQDRVSLNGLGGLHTNKFGVGEGFGETLFGGSANPQIVINKSVLDDKNDPELAVQLIHELFHAAGLHQGSAPILPGIFGTPNDENPEVKWPDIEKNCRIE